MLRLPRIFPLVLMLLSCSLTSAAVQAQGPTRQITVEPSQSAPGASTPAQAGAGQAAPAQTAEPKETAVPAAPTKDAATGEATGPPTPAAAPATPDETLTAEQVVLVLQQELRRVGCYLGGLDGIWGPQSHAALQAFTHYGKLHADSYVPSADWVKVVQGYQGTVCPPNYHRPRAERPGSSPPTYRRPAPRGGYGGY